VERDRNPVMKRYRKLKNPVKKHFDISEYEEDIKKRMVSRKFVGTWEQDKYAIDTYLRGDLKVLATSCNARYCVKITDKYDGEYQTFYFKKDAMDIPVPAGLFQNWWEEDFQKYYKVSEDDWEKLTLEQRVKLECDLQLKLWVDIEYYDLYARFYKSQEWDKWWQSLSKEEIMSEELFERSNKYWKERLHQTASRKFVAQEKSYKDYIDNSIGNEYFVFIGKEKNYVRQWQTKTESDAIKSVESYLKEYPENKFAVVRRRTKDGIVTIKRWGERETRVKSRKFVGISKHLLITPEQYLELEKLLTKYNKGVNSLFIKDLLRDSEYRKEYYVEKGLSKDCLDDVDSILKAKIGALKTFLTEGVWFESYSSDGVLTLVIVDKDKNAKRYEFTSIGKGTYEEFKRKLRQDRQYKGKGYKVLQWLENLYGKGEKVS
jgi:hypothetical protein